MGLFTRLFRRKGSRELLYNQHLDAFCHEVVESIYSRDHSMRYVILKTEQGLFTYTLEAIYHLDEEEWKYYGAQDKSLPAIWEPYGGQDCRSLFDSLETLYKELKAEPEYRQNFGGNNHALS